MYLEICARKKIAPVHVGCIEKQLLAVKKALGEYEIISTRVREMADKAVKQSVEAKASTSSD